MIITCICARYHCILSKCVYLFLLAFNAQSIFNRHRFFLISFCSNFFQEFSQLSSKIVSSVEILRMRKNGNLIQK